MNYNYLINSSINQLSDGINFIINEINKEDSNYSVEYLILYCEKLLECTYNKFRNDDFEYLEPYIVYYKNSFKFIPASLKVSVILLLSIYNELKYKIDNRNYIVRVKK